MENNDYFFLFKIVPRKVKGLAKEHVCIIPRHRQQCGDGQREGGVGSGWRWAKVGKWGHL